MAKVVCVLYDDPAEGYPDTYARDDIPRVSTYPDGQPAPTPSSIGFQPGELLGSVSGELGLRRFLEDQGHELVVTSDKDGEDSVLQRELPNTHVVISQPFWPAYLSADSFDRAQNLQLVITAGVGSDHVDLDAAMQHGVTVAEVTYSNSISVAEHAVMQILGLVRNFLPAHRWVTDEDGWNVADAAMRSYDVEGMTAGVMGCGRIGEAVLRRLKPFNVALHYTDKKRFPIQTEEELHLTYHDTAESLVRSVDVVSIHVPLHPETDGRFNDDLIGQMKRGSYIINTARARICNRDAIVRALESGQLAGYAGDVWYPQPPPADHPWREMPNHAMTPHVSGSTLSAQARYAAGTREILENWLAGESIRDEYLIVEQGALAGTGAQSYTSAT